MPENEFIKLISDHYWKTIFNGTLFFFIFVLSIQFFLQLMVNKICSTNCATATARKKIFCRLESNSLGHSSSSFEQTWQCHKERFIFETWQIKSSVIAPLSISLSQFLWLPVTTNGGGPEPGSSVTRFHKILTLWQNFKNLWQFSKGLLSICKILNLILQFLCSWAYLHCSKWPIS